VVIAEEYLDATHHTVEAVVTGGRVALMGITERRLTPPPHFVTLEHRMSTGSGPLPDRVRTMLDEACAALDYRWGALNVDVMVTTDGRVVLGEWGARLGGNGMAELLYLASGVDATEAYVRMALGQTVDVTARYTRHSAFRAIGAAIDGKLTGIVGLDQARALPGVADIVLAVAPGEHVVPYTRAGAKLGYALTYGDDQAAAVDALDRVERTLSFTVEPAAR
jgi:biotin carboxylase